MEFNVEETMLIIDALNFHNALTSKINECSLSHKRNAIINKFKKQVIGKTKIVRVKK